MTEKSLRDSLQHFERCSVVNGWTEEESAVFFAAALQGEAQNILSGMTDNDCRSFPKLVERLELRFGVE